MTDKQIVRIKQPTIEERRYLEMIENAAATVRRVLEHLNTQEKLVVLKEATARTIIADVRVGGRRSVHELFVKQLETSLRRRT